MATDEERRRVAENLRGPFDVIGQGRYVALNGTLLGMQVMAGSEQELRDGMAELADLIEPSRNCLEPTRTYGECDRDALLELADEFEDTANELLELVGEAGDDIRPYISNSAEGALSYARRIREACGEGEE